MLNSLPLCNFSMLLTTVQMKQFLKSTKLTKCKYSSPALCSGSPASDLFNRVTKE